MVNWVQAWWQLRQSWTYMRHAYRCGWSLYDGVADAWTQTGFAMTYAVAQMTPPTLLMPTRY